MIKRRFYQQEHGDKDCASSGSSSESDSDSDPKSDEELQEDAEDVEEEEAKGTGGLRTADDEDEDEEQEPEIERRVASSGSGYESEDSSGNEVEGDSPGLLANEDDVSGSVGEKPKYSQPKAKENGKDKSGNTSVDMNDDSPADFVNYILKHKSVFKCRLCPRIVCLSEDTVKTHLKSKRHARSKKLLGEGRLKLMLNSDGEIEEEQETHSERHARTLALAQGVKAPKKKDSGRQRQSRRRKKRLRNLLKNAKSEKPMEKPEKKRPKTEA